MKAVILKMLRNSSGYLSGQELCNVLGVSRTAVWKYIHQLKELGYNIEAVSNKGYTLKESPDVIVEEEITSRLSTGVLGKEIRFYEEVDSTNTMAKRLAEEGTSHGTLVVTERQLSGKGRRGRSWSSERGCGIWMTLLLRPKIHPSNASMLTLVTALAVNKAVEELSGLKPQIKWPNDVIMNGKKIGGILTEMSSEQDYINYIIVGMGINVNNKGFNEELQDKATSLYLEGGRAYQRAELIADILKHFEFYYEQFLEHESMKPFIVDYNSKLINTGKEVSILERDKEFTAVSEGINDRGELVVHLDNGSIRNINSGEVSVRGLYSYV